MRNRSAVTHVNLSRRALLKAVPALTGVVLGLSSEMTPDPAEAQVKLSQQVSMYQDKPKNGQQCSTCVLFQPPHSCKIVVDPISPDGWCQFYAKKS